jgi:hypothetical protein
MSSSAPLSRAVRIPYTDEGALMRSLSGVWSKELKV